MVLPREELLGSITFLGKGAGVPTHVAPKGSRYTDTLIPAFYYNMDGTSTGWALEGAPVVEYLADLSGEGDVYHYKLVQMNKRTADWDGLDELDNPFSPLWAGYIKVTLHLLPDVGIIGSALNRVVVVTYEDAVQATRISSTEEWQVQSNSTTPETTFFSGGSVLSSPTDFLIFVASSNGEEDAAEGSFYVGIRRNDTVASEEYTRAAVRVEQFFSKIGIYDDESA